MAPHAPSGPGTCSLFAGAFRELPRERMLWKRNLFGFHGEGVHLAKPEEQPMSASSSTVKTPARPGGAVRRTERLHALTEEIRRRAPAPVSAAWLADRLGVSRRTIERDLAALRSTGVPLQSAVGRRGGNALHPRAVLPPLNLTAAETTALLLSLTVTHGMPYSAAARSAANKLHALLPPATAIGVEHLRSRLRVQPPSPVAAPRVLAVLEQSVADNTSVRLRYTDRNSASTERTVEPAGFYGTPDGWALAAWCQLRDDARLFRLDRIQRATATRQPCQPRDLDAVLGWLPAPTITPT